MSLNCLSQDDLDRSDEVGYLVFEGLLDEDLNQRVKDDVDQLMVDREEKKRPMIMAYSELGPLTSEPLVVDRVADLMGGKKFTHHHIHARWQLPGGRGVPWHQGSAQIPHT